MQFLLLLDVNNPGYQQKWNGYVLHSQHSNSSAGGVTLYVKFNLDYFIREDLSVLEGEFETL